MTGIHVTMRAGTERTIEATDGYSLMAAIRDAGIEELAAICGGSCSCATCHVWIAPDWMVKAGSTGPVEEELLEGSLHRTDYSRLSCQITVEPGLSGLRVTIAPED